MCSPEPSTRPRDRHTLACSHPDQIRLELSQHPENVEQEPPDRAGRVIDTPAEAQRDALGGELVGDVPGVGQWPGKPIELADDQRVSRPHGRHRFAQAGTCAVRPGQAVVDEGVFFVYADRGRAAYIDVDDIQQLIVAELRRVS